MDILGGKDLDGVSYEELFQIHVGVHHPSEDSDDSEKDECHSEPPVFDLQQIKAIAVNAKDLHFGDQSPLNSVEKCLGSQDPQILKIARTLNELIKPSYCSVCLQHAAVEGMHYHSKNHFANIILWIETRTKTNDPSVTKKIFCAPCNLPLIDENERHYSTKTHLQNEKQFCTICFQIITQPMKPDVCCHHINYSQSQDLKRSTQNSLLTNRDTMARELKTKLTSLVCHLCNVNLNKCPKHYGTKKHRKTIRNWIKKNSNTIGSNTANDWCSLYCDACNEVFDYANLAHQHYKTMEHLETLSTFCDICKRNCSTRQVLRAHYKKMHKVFISKPEATGQNLEELTKLDYCYLCVLSFDEDTDAETHYQSSTMHAVKVFDLLEMNKAEFHGNSIGDHKFNSEDCTSSEPNDNSTEVVKDDDNESKHSHRESDVHLSEAFEGNDNKESENSLQKPDFASTQAFEHNDDKKSEHSHKGPNIDSTESFKDNGNRKSEHSHREPDVGSTEEFEDNCNRKSEYSRTEPDVHSAEASKYNCNNDFFQHLDSILKEEIMQEISIVMDKTYYSRSVSLQVVLDGLKTLNRQVADIIENNKLLPNIEESSKTPNINSSNVNQTLPESFSNYKSSSSSITKSPIEKANQDYAKLKLDIEITKMKATLEMCSVEVALKFARGLRTLIMNIGKDNFDVEFVFSFPEVATVYAPRVALNLLKIELEVLERRLTKSKRISLELALDIVTQFNARLEMEAEIIKKEGTTFINYECFENSKEDVADVLPTLKSISDYSLNAKEPHMDKPIKIDQDDAKLQLRVEIARMKKVLSDNRVFLVADAMKYVRGLKVLITKIYEKQEHFFDKVDVGVVFLSTEAIIEGVAGDLVLQRELAGLEWMLTEGRKTIGVEITLDIVTQFNVGLESLINAQKE